MLTKCRRSGVTGLLTVAFWRESPKLSLRKEVIQPQVPLRLPCYDLVPVTEPGVGTTVVWLLRPFPAPMT